MDFATQYGLAAASPSGASGGTASRDGSTGVVTGSSGGAGNQPQGSQAQGAAIWDDGIERDW